MDQQVTVSDPTTWPEHIQQRYAVGRRRRWLITAALTCGLAMLAFITFYGVRVTQRAISAGMASYTTVSDDHMTLRFAVDRREAVAATCVVRGRAQDGFDVGYAVVHLPPEAGSTAHTYELRTAYRGLLGELLGCAVGDQPPPGIPPAQFRAGVIPPEQPWTASGT